MILLKAFRELDQILRGEKTRPEALKKASLDISLRQMIFMIMLLGMLYGLCMSVFSMTDSGSGESMQIIATMIKVPALFLLTLLVTFPSLYVFNALVGSRFGVTELLSLLIAALCVSLSMLASLGLIVAFFSVSTTSYAFMILLNVFVFGTSGFLGLKFLLQTLHRMTVLNGQEEPASKLNNDPDEIEIVSESELEVLEPSGPLDQLEGHILGGQVKTVFRCWIVVFGLVGAQMSWVLRPFIGDPNTPFQWFRPRDSNFFEAVLNTVGSLFK